MPHDSEPRLAFVTGSTSDENGPAIVDVNVSVPLIMSRKTSADSTSSAGFAGPAYELESLGLNVRRSPAGSMIGAASRLGTATKTAPTTSAACAMRCTHFAIVV